VKGFNMSKPKPKFKKNETFWHPEQKVFVIVDGMDYFEGKGWLYNLKCFKHENDEKIPWKRYYESRVMNELVQLKTNNAVKILYGNK
jgi:hypothetical protein